MGSDNHSKSSSNRRGSRDYLVVHNGSGGRKPQTYRKKIHDPVARYRQLQNSWQKDKFLSDNGTRKNLRWQVRQEMLQISGDPYVTRT